MNPASSLPEPQPMFRLYWRPWRELALICLLVMELSWLVPWYRSLTRATYAESPIRVFLVLGGIMLVCEWIVRLMNFIRLRVEYRQVVFIIFLAIAVLVGFQLLLYPGDHLTLSELINRPIRAFGDWVTLIPDELVVALAVVVAGWRGLSLAQIYIEPKVVLNDFRVGIILFLGYVFLNTLVTGETPGVFLYTFLIAGLTAMGAARIAVLSTLRGGGGSPFDRGWFLGMVAATLAVVGVAATIAWFARSGILFEQIGAAILGVFIVVTVAVISPAIYLLPQLAERVPAFNGQVAQAVDLLSKFRSTLMNFSNRLFEFLDVAGIFTGIAKLKPLLLWGGLAAVALLVILGMSRWVFREREGRLVERQSIFPQGELLRALRAALLYQMHKIGAGLSGMAKLRPTQRRLAAARIRRIYAELLDLCEQQGIPRPASQTPLEFLPVMIGLLPEVENQLLMITRAYLHVRYGELPETRQELAAIEVAWDKVQVANQTRSKAIQSRS
jgi:hypothetical protein